jgi:hypothetical protein
MLIDLPAVSFGFYHFAHIMLLRYKPGPKFAIRNVENLSDTDVRTQAFGKHRYVLITIASNPIARTRHLRGEQQLTGDCATGDYRLPYHLHLGTARMQFWREGPSGTDPEQFRKTSRLANNMDHQRTES